MSLDSFLDRAQREYKPRLKSTPPPPIGYDLRAEEPLPTMRWPVAS
jgi:hypothetical protein